MTTTEQELAHLRAEVNRLQAEVSKGITALAECIGQRDKAYRDGLLKAAQVCRGAEGETMTTVKDQILDGANSVIAQLRAELDQRDDTITQLRTEREHWHTVAKCLQATIDQLKAALNGETK